MQFVVIPSDFRAEFLRADKGGVCINTDFKDYCFPTELSLEYASTNTPQQFGISELIEITLAAITTSMQAGSGLPKFLWGELMLVAAFLGNRALHSVIGKQFPSNILHGTEPDLKFH